MSYFYKAKKSHEIETIAEKVLANFPHRRASLAVDIEGILEDLGLDLLPRQGIRHIAEGYLARDPRIIVIDESILSYLPRARFTIAEEVCHLILEYELWHGGSIPEGAQGHELSDKQHFFVEKDAKALASALLMPREDFSVTFRQRFRELVSAKTTTESAVREALNFVAKQFEISPKAAFYRARNLKLLDQYGDVT